MSSLRNVRGALAAYVLGKDRVRKRETKLGAPEARPDSPIEFGRSPARARFGVPIPDRLEFHRGPAARRDAVPSAEVTGDA